MTEMGKVTRATPQRVLVIEEDQGVRKMLRYSLQTTGFSVTEATTFTEAIQALKQHPSDAVVLDLVDGPKGELLWQLQELAQQQTPSPVWVVISALDQTDVTTWYGPLGNNFIAKPFNPWDLVNTLEGLLTGTGESGNQSA